MNENEQYSCGCSVKNNEIKYYSVPTVGSVATEAGNINVISTKWSLCDYAGEIRVRLDIGRMNYAVTPGIYAIGKPDRQSPVLVSANYKLSFDILRRELKGLNVWIIVIDSKGVNVWCAAGKGTFGTEELVRRVNVTGLEKIISIRKLIVPQLGAPGISAHTVQKLCGFQVIYGPVRASDIKKYIAAGMKASPEMRHVDFGVIDRLTVSWLELALAARIAILGTVLLIGLVMLIERIPALAGLKGEARLLPILFLVSILSGTVFNAVLLPFLPGRAFSLKGGVLGAFICSGVIYASGQYLAVTTWLSLILMSSGISAFLALNFTGASTYTSLSGVKKEIRYSIPLIVAMVSCGAFLEIVHILRRFM